MTILSWAETRSPDRRVHRASAGLRCARYQADGVVLAEPIGGLRVSDPERPLRGAEATWHESTGIYGFVDAPAGTRELTVTDPAGRFLPRRVRAAFPDRSDPAADPGAVALDVAMFPAFALPIPPGETVLWGVVRDADESPVSLAFVTITTTTTASPPRTFRGLTDVHGVYVLWLVGELADPGPAPTRTLEAYRPRERVDPDQPWKSVPLAFESMQLLDADFVATYELAAAVVSAGASLGRRSRIDIRFP